MAIPNLKAISPETLEESLHAAKRALKQRTQELEDLRDAAALRIRKAPMESVGLALGVGVILGLAAGVIGALMIKRDA